MLPPAQSLACFSNIFFESMTQSQIAERIGVSQMQVSRILANTLRRLRDQLE
jgi:RNA polymerase sigma-B factor